MTAIDVEVQVGTAPDLEVELQLGDAPAVDVAVTFGPPSLTILSVLPTGPRGLAGTNGTNGTNGQGVPIGGTTGQVLAKDSNTDFDTEWVDPSAGGGGAVDSVDGQTGVVVLSAVYQPLDSDLTAIAALTTTAFGRALLALADAAAGRTAFGLGTVATHAHSEYDLAGAAVAAQAASQPLDSDLTAIAALTTTAFGRAFLALADAAAGRTALGLGTAATSASGDFQPIDSDLTAIAALTTTAFGRGLLILADAAALRSAAGLGTAATNNTGDFDTAGAAAAAQAASQPLDSDLTAIAALTTTSYGRAFLALADAAAARTAIGAGIVASVVAGTNITVDNTDPANPIVASTGGSGLPPQWTDGGNGDVTATVDDIAETPITIQAFAGQTAPLLILKDENGVTVGTVDPSGNFHLTPSDPLHNDHFLIEGAVGSSANDTDLFRIVGDVDGEIVMTANGGFTAREGADGSDGIVLLSHGNRLHLGDFGASNEASLTLAAPSPGFGIDASAVARITRWTTLGDFIVQGTHAPPDDATLANGECGIWFDPTNGAARICFKGKTLDGTVVEGFGPMGP